MRIRRRRRHHDVALASEPKNDRRDEHERARDSKGEGGTEIAQEARHQRRSEQGTKVDYPIECVEHDLRPMLVGLIELIADERRNTRLDPAGAERDQSESDVETDAIENKHRETGLPHAVDQTEPEDDVIFAEETIRQPAAEERKKINADHESVKNILRCVLAVRFRQVEEQRRNQKHRQDVAHPVKAEALATFVADDVADLARDRRLGVWHRWRAQRSDLRIDYIRFHRGERWLRGAAAQSQRWLFRSQGARLP